MDDSTQSLLGAKTPSSFNICLTLFAKAVNPPRGNENHSVPPLQLGWISRPSALNCLLTVVSAVRSFSVTGNVCPQTNRWGFPVWSSLNRAWQLFAVLFDEPTFPNGGAGWFRQRFIVMIYTSPMTTVFLGFCVFCTLLGPAWAGFFVLAARGGCVFLGFDDVFCWRPPWPDTFASSAGSNHSEESAPVLL